MRRPFRSRVLVLLTFCCSLACSSQEQNHLDSTVPEGVEAGVLTDGTRDVHYVEWPGDGVPLVMVHGLGGNAPWWSSVARLLPGRDIIAVDLPGHGLSPPTDEWQIEPMGRSIAALTARCMRMGSRVSSPTAAPYCKPCSRFKGNGR
jgi:hypothetical protein